MKNTEKEEKDMTKDERNKLNEKFMVYRNDDLDREIPEYIGTKLNVKDAIKVFNDEIRNHSNRECYLSFLQHELLVYDPDARCVSTSIHNLNDPFNYIEMPRGYTERYYWDIDKKNLEREISDYYDNFNRANSTETISEYFINSGNSDFDSSDTDFARGVTVVEPGKYDMKDPCDRFTRFVYDNVRVVRGQGDDGTDPLCDWCGFIYENYDALREFSNKYWVKGNYDGIDDYTDEWIEQLQLMLSGYGTDRDYRNFMECITNHSDDNELSNPYMVYLRDSLIPYALPENEKKYTDVLEHRTVREIKGIYPEEETQLEKEIRSQAANDFEKGREFPDNGNFNGLQNFRIMAEINDTVLGVRTTDNTYATWQGDSEYGVSGGHYMMTRSQALEDFAIRGNLIDNERYKQPNEGYEKNRKEVEEYLSMNNYNSATLEDIDGITARYLDNMNSDNADSGDSFACLESAVDGYYQDQAIKEQKKHR